MSSCNMCRDGRTYFGQPCKNGCPFHAFPDGSVLSFRYTKISGDPERRVMGDVWSYRLHRGYFDPPEAGRSLMRFRRVDDVDYNPADYPATK